MCFWLAIDSETLDFGFAPEKPMFSEATSFGGLADGIGLNEKYFI
ncbi:hypothetical protein [Sphingomonas parapaucimobilis]